MPYGFRRFIAMLFAYGAAEGWFWPLYLLVLVLYVYLYRWTAMRLNDVGWSRWWTLLWLVPAAGLVMGVALCFRRPRPVENTADAYD